MRPNVKTKIFKTDLCGLFGTEEELSTKNTTFSLSISYIVFKSRSLLLRLLKIAY